MIVLPPRGRCGPADRGAAVAGRRGHARGRARHGGGAGAGLEHDGGHQPVGVRARAGGGVRRRSRGRQRLLLDEQVHRVVGRHVGPHRVAGAADEGGSEAGVDVEAEGELAGRRRRRSGAGADGRGRARGRADGVALGVDRAEPGGRREAGVLEHGDADVGRRGGAGGDGGLGAAADGDRRRPDAHLGVVGGGERGDLGVRVAGAVGDGRGGGGRGVPDADLDDQPVAGGHVGRRRDGRRRRGHAGARLLHERRRRGGGGRGQRREADDGQGRGDDHDETTEVSTALHSSAAPVRAFAAARSEHHHGLTDIQAIPSALCLGWWPATSAQMDCTVM